MQIFQTFKIQLVCAVAFREWDCLVFGKWLFLEGTWWTATVQDMLSAEKGFILHHRLASYALQ